MKNKSINFVYFGKEVKNNILPSLYIYCLMSYRYFNPDIEINLHSNCISNLMIGYPSLKKVIEKCNISIIKSEPKEFVFNNPIIHYAHRVDVYKLDNMVRNGGLWVDLDTICVKNLDHVFENEFVFCNEYIQKTPRFCIGFIYVENKEFLKEWYNSYKTFKYEYTSKYWSGWDYHSAVIPYGIFNEKYLDSKKSLFTNTFGFGIPNEHIPTTKRHQFTYDKILKEDFKLDNEILHFHLCSNIFKEIYDFTVIDWYKYNKCNLTNILIPVFEWYKTL